MESLSMLHKIAHALPFATLVVNLSGKIAWWNTAAEQIFGWKSSEVLDRPIPIIPSDRQDEFGAFQEIVTHGRTLCIKSVRQRKDGAMVKVNVIMLPLRDEAGAIEGSLILYEPIPNPVCQIARKAKQSREEFFPSGGYGRGGPTSTPFSDLTPRQREITILVGRGQSNRDVAKCLSVGEQVVKNYLRSIYRELHVASRTELVAWLNKQRANE